MKTRQYVAAALVAMMAGGAPATAIAGAQGNVTLAGTAKDEARKPYAEFSARARELQKGQIAGTIALDDSGNFSLSGIPANQYVIELVNQNGKVVCTEGPFDMTKQGTKTDVVVDCDRVPVAWWLLGAAAAAGITAGVVSGGPASAAQ